MLPIYYFYFILERTKWNKYTTLSLFLRSRTQTIIFVWLNPEVIPFRIDKQNIIEAGVCGALWILLYLF